MESVKQWCITVSAVSIISGVMMCLVPRGASKSTYRVLVGIILLYTMVLPLTNLREYDFDFSEIIPQSSTDTTDYHEGELYVAEKTYEKFIASELGGLVSDIKCECGCIYTNGEIILKSVKIKTRVSQEEEKLILETLRSIINDNTTVRFGGDEYEGG